MDCRVKRGNDDAEGHSRGAFFFAPEVWQRQSKCFASKK
jgi:hypothetical protein